MKDPVVKFSEWIGKKDIKKGYEFASELPSDIISTMLFSDPGSPPEDELTNFEKGMIRNLMERYNGQPKT